MSTQFDSQKHFYFKLFKQLYITIQFSLSTVDLVPMAMKGYSAFPKLFEMLCSENVPPSQIVRRIDKLRWQSMSASKKC